MLRIAGAFLEKSSYNRSYCSAIAAMASPLLLRNFVPSELRSSITSWCRHYVPSELRSSSIAPWQQAPASWWPNSSAFGRTIRRTSEALAKLKLRMRSEASLAGLRPAAHRWRKRPIWELCASDIAPILIDFFSRKWAINTGNPKFPKTEIKRKLEQNWPLKKKSNRISLLLAIPYVSIFRPF